jgi:hypothetical protein
VEKVKVTVSGTISVAEEIAAVLEGADSKEKTAALRKLTNGAMLHAYKIEEPEITFGDGGSKKGK